jgi:transcriptional regulator with XRE-family HTH domain
MEDITSPLLLRRRLRTELLVARQKRELTQQQVAKAMDWSLSKMNRIEKAKSGISVNDLKVLLPYYGITDEERTDELVELARAARRPGWWRHYSDVASPELLELIDYESAASSVSQFETMFVPGILQTEEYALAVLQVFYDENSGPRKVAALVELRTKRRDLLTSENAPHFSFVLDESVIRRLVSSPAVTSRQLEHLVNAAKLPNVTIQIVPFAAGLHPGMEGPFELVQFDDMPDENIAFVEGQGDTLITDDPHETKDFLKLFQRITEKSLAPSDSVGLMLEAAAAMA